MLSACENSTQIYRILTFGSLVAQIVKNLPAMWATWVRSLCWDNPLEKGTGPHSSILAWKIPMDRGAWWATIHGVRKSQTRLSDFHFQKGYEFVMFRCTMGFSGGSDSKESTCNAGDLGPITG